MANVTRCDGCGREAPTRHSFLRLLGPHVGDALARLMAIGISEQPLDAYDLCSWKCAADLATLKALDPTPPAA